MVRLLEVIRAMSSYHPERSALNGRMASRDRASINVPVAENDLGGICHRIHQGSLDYPFWGDQI